MVQRCSVEIVCLGAQTIWQVIWAM
jgi:hypothetical protein